LRPSLRDDRARLGRRGRGGGCQRQAQDRQGGGVALDALFGGGLLRGAEDLRHLRQPRRHPRLARGVGAGDRGGPGRGGADPLPPRAGGAGMILDRYLARTYARIALSTFLAIVAVVLVIDFADRAYSFRGEGWFQNMLRLYANLAIDLGYQAAPSAFLVAAGITVSSLRAQGEYVAFLALGNRPGRLIAVLLGTVSVFCLGLLVLHETVAADAARRAEEIKIRDFRRPQNIGAYFQQSQWFRSGKWVYNLREREGAGFRNVTLYELGDDFSLVRRIDAEAMLPKSDGWRFEHAR